MRLFQKALRLCGNAPDRVAEWNSKAAIGIFDGFEPCGGSDPWKKASVWGYGAYFGQNWLPKAPIRP
jgi:hypothetical protein